MSLSRKQKIIIFAMILVACAIGGGVFYKRHAAQKAKNRLFENPFSGVNQEIDLQSGNYANEALVVDGYVYFYKSRVELGNYDHVDELKKCGNNVIYRLSPDGTYEEFYTFDYGDAIYYSVRSKLYYYNEYFYIQIGNRIYRINKEGTRAEIIYENMGEGSLAFGIRDHHLVLQKARQYYCLNLDKWDWSQPIEVGRMRHLLNVDTELFDLYEGVIYGSRYELSDNAVVLLDHQLKVWNEEEKELEKIASDVYCLNVYKGDAFYAQSVDDGVCIKYRSFDGESEVELFTINPDENKSIKSLVVSDDFIIYDLGPGNYEDGVDMRVIWNRNTGETQETIVYR